MLRSSRSCLFAFESHIKHLQRTRAAQLPDAHKYDYMRDEISRQIVDRLDDIQGRDLSTIVAYAGSSSAVLAEELVARDTVEKLYLVDDCRATLENLKRSVSESKNEVLRKTDIEYVKFADIGELTTVIPAHSVDLFVTPLMAHWHTDLGHFFKGVASVLKPDAATVGAMFSTHTLWELRNSWTLGENERSGGVSAHVSPFAGPNDVGGAIKKAGLVIPTIDLDDVEIRYRDPFLLMHELGRMGESNAAVGRRTDKVMRQELYAAAAIYQHLYGKSEEEGGGIPASFTILHWIAWAKDDKQQKPLERGTGEVSLKDISTWKPGPPKK